LVLFTSMTKLLLLCACYNCPMKIMVTGCAGFIGSHLSERLTSLGHEVIGVDKFSDYYPVFLKELNAKDLESKGVKIYKRDILTSDLTDICKDIDFVFHLAATPGISDKIPYEEYLNNNELATFKLLQHFRKSPNLKCFFNISTSSVYGAFATDAENADPKPTSYYGVTKLAAEQLALSYSREEGFPACSFRLFSVYGERERPDKFYPRLIMALLEGREVPLYEGSEKHIRSYTYISDIIDGFILGLDKYKKCCGEIFNLGTDKTNTTGDAMRIAQEIVNKPLKIKRLPKRTGDQEKTSANIEKIKRVLGYASDTTLEEGLEKDISWFKNRILGKYNYWEEVFGK